MLGLGAAPANAAEKWNSGSTKYTTITNCPSIIWGSPYQEFGIGAFVSYWGDQTTNPVSPATGSTTYLNTYAMLVGSHCGTPKLFPRFVLPGGVEFDKTQKIRVLLHPAGSRHAARDHPRAECPQWSNVSANGYYTSTPDRLERRLAAALGQRTTRTAPPGSSGCRSRRPRSSGGRS